MIEFLPSLRKPYNVYGFLSASGQVSSRGDLARRRRRSRRVATKLPPWRPSRNFSPPEPNPSAMVYILVSIEVTESATRGNSSHFALQIPPGFLCFTAALLDFSFVSLATAAPASGRAPLSANVSFFFPFSSPLLFPFFFSPAVSLAHGATSP